MMKNFEKISYFSKKVKMLRVFKKNMELITLLGFVVGSVSFGSSMFVYKLYTNPNIRIDKTKRQQIIRET